MERMAKLLDVSTSGYYGWFSRPESGREQKRRLLDVLVKAAYEASRGRYGSLKISTGAYGRSTTPRCLGPGRHLARNKDCGPSPEKAYRLLPKLTSASRLFWREYSLA